MTAHANEEMFTKTYEMVAEFKLVRQAKEFADRYISSWSRESGSTTITDLVVDGRKVTWTATVANLREDEIYCYPLDLRENAGAIGGTSAKVNGIRARREYY